MLFLVSLLLPVKHSFEKAVTGGSVVFLTIVVVCGIAIAYEAYVKATGTESILAIGEAEVVLGDNF